METSIPHDKISIQDKINQLQYKQQIEKFNKNLQKGDLGLSELIPYGFIVYGDTRAGKTALAHVLSKNSLKGVKINGDFMVVTTTSKNRKAKIGNTMNSQTLVPNNFPVQLKGKQFNLIDTPGYGDTNGMLTILANGYYHYRLYSKVQNMKFIICFDAIQLLNTASEFINSIKQWTNSFKDYLQVRKEIWESVAFVITKVEDKPTIKQDLISKLKNIAKDLHTLQEKNVEEAIKQLIEYIIEKDRIFYVKKIKEGETLVQADLLERIDNKISKWWSRDYDATKNEVDMSKVTFALSQQIIESTTKYPLCKRQFIELINYYNLRIKQFRQLSGALDCKNFSLTFVIQQLIQDAMGPPDSHKFIQVMENYINLYYNKYDDSYNEERAKLQEELFKNKDGPQLALQLTQRSRGKFRGKDKNYLVKKFRCLQEIQLLKAFINSVQLKERDVKSIELCATAIYKIIKEFNHIAFKKSYSSKIIYKYGYIIHRIIQQAKIFILLIQIYGAADRPRIMEQSNNQFFELLRQLIDFMGVSFKYNKNQVTYEELHLAFINQFDFKDPQYQSLLINEDLVTFFTDFDITQQQDMDKQTQVVLKYSDKVLEEAQKLSMITFDKQKGKLIRRLTNIRINCDNSYYQTRRDPKDIIDDNNSYYEMRMNPQKKNQIMFTIRKTTKNLGKLLELLGQYKLSRSVYGTIRFVDSVCKLFRFEINLLKKANLKNEDSRKKEFDLRIQFSNYLSEHFRQHQAIEVLQESFELAENMGELKRVKEQLCNLRFKIKDPPNSEYQQILFNEQFFDPFNEKLSNQLEDFSKSAVEL